MAEPPTQKEQELLETFKSRIKNLNLTKEQSEDIRLLRWLRARDLDLEKAEQMLKNSMKWRKEKGIDKIIEWSPDEFLLEEYPYVITGFLNEENCPVLFVQVGRWDIKKAVDAGMKEDFVRTIFKLYETLCDEMREKIDQKTNLPVTQAIFICDFEHYSFMQLSSLGAVQSMLESAKEFDLNYPEILKACYIIKLNRISCIIYNMIKSLLGARTQAKMHVFNTDEKNWKPALHKLLPVNLIPTYYGGTCTKGVLNNRREREMDLHPNFLKSQVNGDVEGNHKADADEESKIEDLTTTISKLAVSELTEAKVKAGCKHLVEVEIKGDFAILSWTFKIELYDIGFSLINEQKEELVAYARVDSKSVNQNGSFVCDKPGKYFLCFDNAYSFMREKTFQYSVKVD